MAEHHNEIPPRPEGWTMDYSKSNNVTNYWGLQVAENRLERDKRNYKKLWEDFSKDFRSQPTRETPGQHGSFNPPLDQIEWKETNP